MPKHAVKKKSNTKKKIAIAVIIVLVLCVIGSCSSGGDNENPSDVQSTVSTESSQSQSEPASQDSGAASSETAENSTSEAEAVDAGESGDGLDSYIRSTVFATGKALEKAGYKVSWTEANSGLNDTTTIEHGFDQYKTLKAAEKDASEQRDYRGGAYLLTCPVISIEQSGKSGKAVTVTYYDEDRAGKSRK